MDNKIGKMFCVGEQPHQDFILRSARNTDQDRRKSSAAYKKRNRSDRDREKQANSKLLHYPSEEVRPKQPQPDLASCFRQQSLGGPEERAAGGRGGSRQKHREFSIIMESIKDVLRSNERQSQEAREVREFRSKFDLRDEFLCLRSKLHEQLCRSELRDEQRSRECEQ